jgi:WD40 repeat protein
MKIREKSKRFGVLLLWALLLLAVVSWSADLLVTRESLERLRAELSELEEGFRLEWSEAKEKSLAEQSPFESDIRFFERYLKESSITGQRQQSLRDEIYKEITDLLGWHFQTKSMEIELDVGNYDANQEIWQVSIRHNDWESESLEFGLEIGARDAEALYVNREQIRIYGDIVFDMQTQPKLSNIYLSSAAAEVETSLSLGVLQEYELSNAATAIEFDEVGKRLFVGSRDKSLHIFDLYSGECLGNAKRFYGNIRAIRKLPLSERVALVLNDGYLRIYDLSSQKEVFQQRHLGSVDDLSINADGRFAAIPSLDNRMRIYDLKTGKKMRELEYAYGIKTCDLSPAGDYFAYGTEHGSSQIFEYAVVRIFEPGNDIHKLEFASSGEVERLRFSSDGTFLLYSGSDGSAAIIELSTGTKKYSFSRVYMAEWLQGNDMIIGLGNDRELNIISTRDQDILKTISHTEVISSFAVSPCGNYVAIGSDSGVYLYKL